MLEQLDATRLVADPAALDALHPPENATLLRTADDEALLVGAPVSSLDVHDDHAIVLHDTSWCGAWVDIEPASRFLSMACEFSLPSERPALAQGMVANIAVKLWVEEDRVLFVVPLALAAEFAARYRR